MALEDLHGWWVGLWGVAKAGKDTAARIMDNHGWSRVSIFDVPRKTIDSLVAREFGLNPAKDKDLIRPLYVEYGRIGRAIDRKYWINRAAASTGPVARNVVTDVRYIDEIEWILGRGGVIVRIDRPGYSPANQEEADSFAAIDDAIQKGSIPPIERITNDGTERELGIKVLRIAERHYSRAV